MRHTCTNQVLNSVSALSGLEAVLGQPAEFAQPFVNLVKQRVPGERAVLAATPHRHAGK